MIQALVQFAVPSTNTVETIHIGASVRADFGKGVHKGLRARGLALAPIVAKNASCMEARWFIQTGEWDAVGPVTWHEVMRAAGIEV